jgi:hypothetical protein
MCSYIENSRSLGQRFQTSPQGQGRLCMERPRNPVAPLFFSVFPCKAENHYDTSLCLLSHCSSRQEVGERNLACDRQ